MAKRLKCGLLGEKLGHSYSKQIHACFSDYEYELYPVSCDEAEAIIKSGEFDGLNITIPYKELAYSLCDELDPFAAEAKSVNTIVYRGGKICGYNTDVSGFIAMAERAGIPLCGKKVIILGSGGTSKTARLAAETLGAEKIYIVSRRGEINYENVYDIRDAEVIINTTPVGMYPHCGKSPISLSRFSRCEGVCDVIYNPAKTRLLFEAEKLGIKNTGGLYMLAAQGARASEIFMGKALNKSLIDKAVDSVSRDMKNIILIGMPGSGKSSIAKAISERLGRKLIDTDEEIRKRFSPPAEIIKSHGEDEFRKIETEILAQFGRERGLVISTGGGIVEREENYELIRQNGTVFLIERPLALLATEGRPLSSDISALYERRKEKYSRMADITIENTGSIEQAVQKIIEKF